MKTFFRGFSHVLAKNIETGFLFSGVVREPNDYLQSFPFISGAVAHSDDHPYSHPIQLRQHWQGRRGNG